MPSEIAVARRLERWERVPDRDAYRRKSDGAEVTAIQVINWDNVPSNFGILMTDHFLDAVVASRD